ncbi:MAG: hypothetical protein JRI45_11125 [Deltaproteobacteria bacterium]|nr:hypothetical protein [Deltaproteobacteria bacterium]MBW2069481.1 hypothetical protein [Deltaproteobacteria bacterium]
MTPETIAKALGKASRTKDGFLCLCPVHDDRNPSLHVSQKDGKILVHCFAGCTQEAVIEALKERGLWVEDTEVPTWLPHGIWQTRNGKRAIAYWTYRNEDGEIIGHVVRYEAGGRKEIIPFFKREGENWKAGAPEKPRPLYNLHKVTQRPEKTILICEGEKAANVAEHLFKDKYITTTSLGGSKNFHTADWSPLRGRRVIIWPDADEPGVGYALGVIGELRKVGAKIEGVVDFEALGFEFGSGKDAADITSLDSLPLIPVGEFEARYAKNDGKKDEHQGKKKKHRRQSQATIIVQLAFKHGVELFHTPDGKTYASIPVDDHIETYPILKGNSGLRSWLRKLFFEECQKSPGNQALQDAIYTLSAFAEFEGKEIQVFTRIAEHDGKIYVDLCDKEWRAVEISQDGWQVVENPPVKFRRSRDAKPLPVPKRGQSLELLEKYVNVASESDFTLVISWLLAALRPSGPYPILILQGEQGCAKTTTARVLRSLVDPSASDTRTVPREERDLMITATNSWCICLDNLSGISIWLSDALCRLSTGGGFSARKLYEDDEEVILDAMRPIILNGIDEIATRPDLLDRSIVLNLPVIPEQNRQTEREFWGAFEKDKPYILGALFDAIATGLRNFPNVSAQPLPRMADFAEWILACESALPHANFMTAYYGNRGEAIQNTLEMSLLGQGILRLLEKTGMWEGTATELLNDLHSYMSDEELHRKAWPKTPQTLSNQLKRIASLLRHQGIGIEWTRQPGTGKKIIRLGTEKTVTIVTSVTPGEKSNNMSKLQCDDKKGGSSHHRHTQGETVTLTSGCDDGDDKCDGPVTMGQFCNYPKLLNCDDCDGRDDDLHTQSKDKKHNDDDWVEGYV